MQPPRFDEVTLQVGRLRELTEADLDALQSLFERARDYFQLHEGRDPHPAEAREEWHALPPDTPRNHKHVIGLFAPDLAGVVEVVRDWPHPGTWNIGLALLDPAVRGAGVGTQVLDAVDAWAARSGSDRLRVTVSPANDMGLRFWRRLGFANVSPQPAPDRIIALERPVNA